MLIRTAEAKARIGGKVANARRGFTSWQGFKDWAQVTDTALDQVRIGHSYTERSLMPLAAWPSPGRTDMVKY